MRDVDLLFPFASYWWVYAAFTAGVLAVLAVDLGVFHRQAHAVTFRESLAWSAVWVALALAVNYGFYRYALTQFGGDVAARVGLEFLTGHDDRGDEAAEDRPEEAEVADARRRVVVRRDGGVGVLQPAEDGERRADEEAEDRPGEDEGKEPRRATGR